MEAKGGVCVVCPVKCSRCKYRRIRDGENYCILYQSLCRRIYGYCRRNTRDSGVSVNRVGRI